MADTKPTPAAEDPFAGMSEAKRPQVKFGKVGDWFKGTLTDNTRQVENQLSAKHEMQTVFEFKMHGGSFHDIVESAPGRFDPVAEATEIEKDSFLTYFGKGAVQSQMRNVKIGQIVGMRFAEEKPSSKPGMNPTKIIKVMIGEMDPTYQGETAADFATPAA